MTTDAIRMTPAIWDLDPKTTVLTVTATKAGFIKIPATLSITSSELRTEGDVSSLAVEITADAGSYTSRNAKRNDHIRSADFLDADNHPEIAFRSGGAQATSDGYRIEGTATVKGVETPLTLEVSNVEISERTAMFTARADLDRAALGLGKLPSAVIGPRVQLEVSGVAHARGDFPSR